MDGAIAADAGMTCDFALVHLPGGRKMVVRVACNVIREGLTEYLENALPPEKRQGFEDHLSSCRDCRALLDEVRAVASSLARLPREPMPPELTRSIRESFASRFAK